MAAPTQLFGEIALEKGYLTVSQLYEALTLQASDVTRGCRYRFIGEVLTDLGYLTEEQVLDVLRAAGKAPVPAPGADGEARPVAQDG